MMTKVTDESTFDRGACWLLAGVSLFVLLVLWNTVAVLRLPGDGWQIDYNDRDQGIHRLIFFIGDWPTLLQVDDVVTAVNNQPLPTAVQMAPQTAAANWVAGETAQYTVQRQGKTLSVPVTLHRLSLALPICLAIAILRYRLFDIELIIRKTLVYTLLSVLLALIYFGTVVLLQSVVGRAADEQSPLVIVVSTLLIAALFSPLRRGLQAVIDRRFFRQRYDAQQILARFAKSARDEVEMENLTTELLSTIQEIVQPEQLSLWLPDGQRGKS